jgi:hypothetical protein
MSKNWKTAKNKSDYYWDKLNNTIQYLYDDGKITKSEYSTILSDILNYAKYITLFIIRKD